jgi:hypothetical protein
MTMLTYHKFYLKLFGSEVNEIVKSTNIEVATLQAEMTTLRSELTAQMATLRVEMTQQLSALQGTVLLDFIRNVISTALLLFAGEQPYGNLESHRFRCAKGPFLTRITKYFEDSNYWEIQKFKNAADGVISRCNGAFHPVNVEELDGLIKRAKDAIDSCPSVRAELKPECIILDDYNDLKKCFPALR